MGIEDVHGVEPQPLQALVERCDQTLARVPLAIRARPHIVPGLGGDDDLVAVLAQRLVEDPAEHRLGAAGGRAVVVGQVEVGDAVVDGCLHARAAAVRIGGFAEIVPDTQGDFRQKQAAAAATAVIHRFIARLGEAVIFHRFTKIEDLIKNFSKNIWHFQKSGLPLQSLSERTGKDH